MPHDFNGQAEMILDTIAEDQLLAGTTYDLHTNPILRGLGNSSHFFLLTSRI